jgi:hypothetical protein
MRRPDPVPRQRELSMCHAKLEHTNECLGTQVTQHAKLETPSGSDMACHIGFQFYKPDFGWFSMGRQSSRTYFPGFL